MNITLLLILFGILSAGCQTNINTNSMHTLPENCSDQLEKKLLELRYHSIWLQVEGSTWTELSQQYNDKCFEQLLLDEKASGKARFFAAEILFLQHGELLSKIDKKTLNSLYAKALANNYTSSANAWGLPGETDVVGQHLLSVSDGTTTEVWEALLDNNEKVLYEGSEEATFGNSYNYRIKDIAAYYLSKMKNVDYVVHEDPKKRDKKIEQLKKK